MNVIRILLAWTAVSAVVSPLVGALLASAPSPAAVRPTTPRLVPAPAR